MAKRKGRTFDLFTDLRDLINYVEEVGGDDVERAAEIFKEEFLAFFKELRANSAYLKPFRDPGLEITHEGSGNDVVFTITIDNAVYHILDEGDDQVPRYAKDYGLKAFPLVRPRGPQAGSNRLMSTPELAPSAKSASERKNHFSTGDLFAD